MSRNTVGKGKYDTIVVGGGPSGMMAAILAARRGKRVLLIEKNRELGVKLSITGGGRCNITNAEFDTRALLSEYGDASKFLHSPFAQFGVRDTIDFFESQGLKLVVEDRKRAFPKSHKATDVTAFFVRQLERAKVDVMTNAPVLEVLHEKRRITGVRTKAQVYSARSYVISTGGVSHPETGSTGDGFAWLKALGHTVTEPSPDIVPITVRDAWVKNLKGVTIDDAHLTFTAGEKRLKRHGKMVFTHFGLSGPVVLNCAHEVKRLLEMGPVTVSLDLFPSMDIGPLREKLLEHFDEHKNKTLKNVMKTFAPHGLGDTILERGAPHAKDTKVHSVSKADRERLVDVMKGLVAEVSGTKGYAWSVVSDGGVVLSEVDTRTMVSKKYDNLFLTGDVLNVSRPSGGYSLQLAWTTGYVAGSHA